MGDAAEQDADDLAVKCSICRRERTRQDDVDYHPMQVMNGSPLGWYSGDDGEVCPEDMEKQLRGQQP